MESETRPEPDDSPDKKATEPAPPASEAPASADRPQSVAEANQPDEDEKSRAARRRKEKLLRGMKVLREILPGDASFGDPLSTAGREQSQVVGRALSDATAERPGLLREAGLSALQVLQALAGEGDRGEEEVTIAFTDLVNFSRWALSAGDEAATRLLRDVGHAIEPAVIGHGGKVVKWLGDGMMAVFDEPAEAVNGLLEARDEVAAIEVAGYDPQIRAGIHLGKPRRVGSDYLGIDVNVAARVTEAGSGGELLISDRALEKLDPESVKVRRKRFFRAKGVPRDMTVYAVR
jgi:adenylate cyclase